MYAKKQNNAMKWCSTYIRYPQEFLHLYFDWFNVSGNFLAFCFAKKIFMNWNIATWWLGWKPQWCWEQQISNYFKMLNERFKRIENKNISRDFLWKKRCSWDSFGLSTVRHFIISKCLQFNRSPISLMPLHLKIDGKCGVCLHTIWKMAASKALTILN